MAGDLNDFGDEGAREAASAEVGVDVNTDATDMAFPTAVLLVQSADAENLGIAQSEKREVPFQINICTPIMNDRPLGDAVLYEEQFARRNGGEEIEEAIFIVGFEGAEFGAEIAVESGGLGELFENKIEGHKGELVLGFRGWCAGQSGEAM